MTREYRESELANARKESASARAAFLAARNRAERRDAEEKLLFWQGKEAYLIAAVCEETDWMSVYAAEDRQRKHHGIHLVEGL